MKLHHPALNIRELNDMNGRLGRVIIPDCLTALVARVTLLTRLNPIMNNAGNAVSGAASTAIHKATALAGLGNAGVIIMAAIRREFIDAHHDVFPFTTMRTHTIITVDSTLNIVSDFMRDNLFDKVICIVLSNVKLKHKLTLEVIAMTTTGSIALEDDILRTLESLIEELFSDHEALFNLFDDFLLNVALHGTILP